MKAFVDLGMKDGDTLLAAIGAYPEVGLFVGFEPVQHHFHVAKHRFMGSGFNIALHNAAVMIQDEMAALRTMHVDQNFFGGRSTFISEKAATRGDYFVQEVLCIDLRHWLSHTFTKSDEVALKVDVEGYEYDLLEGLIKAGMMGNITRIFCEWHWDKMENRPEERHNALVAQLQKMGYDLTGKSVDDEFSLRIQAGKK